MKEEKVEAKPVDDIVVEPTNDTETGENEELKEELERIQEEIDRNESIRKDKLSEAKRLYPHMVVASVSVNDIDYILRSISFPEIYDLFVEGHVWDAEQDDYVVDIDKFTKFLISHAVIYPESFASDISKGNLKGKPGNVLDTLTDAIMHLSCNGRVFVETYEGYIANYELKEEEGLKITKPSLKEIKEFKSKYENIGIIRVPNTRTHYVIRSYDLEESYDLKDKLNTSNASMTDSILVQSVQEFLVDNYVLFPKRSSDELNMSELYGAPGYLVANLAESIYQISGGINALESMEIYDA